jgi:hypothetical protein
MKTNQQKHTDAVLAIAEELDRLRAENAELKANEQQYTFT